METIFKSISKKHISELAKLRQRKFRRLNGQFFISGLRAVRGSLQAAGFEPQAILLQKGREELLQDLPAVNSAVPRYLLDENDFSRISDESSPQGIALLTKRPYKNQPEQQAYSSVLL